MFGQQITEVYFYMSKLTREQKIEIYTKRKCGETVISLSRQYPVEIESIKYLIRLIDLHGFSVLNTGKNNYYSMDLKLQMITKVLVNSQSIQSTAIEFGLPSKSILSQWITKYKENNYVIVEKTKGRTSTMNKNTVRIKKYQDMTPEEKVKYLEEKNIYLEAENEYLKKLRAVVQNRKNRQQKKK